MPRINIAPSTNMIRGIREDRFNFKGCLAEIFDNSFDAGATVIQVTTDERQFSVCDNGSGVENIESLFKLGKHYGTGQTIGRYGVGFKDAAIWMADACEVDSYNNRERLRCYVNWRAMETSEEWSLDYQTLPSRKSIPYTVLTFHEINKQRVRWGSGVNSQLAYEFRPALCSGAVVQIDDVILQALALPSITDEMQIDEEFEGKHFRLTAGIKADGSDPGRYGYDVAYRHRLIMQRDTRRAFGDYGGRRFYGYLELLDDGAEDWTLGTHKEEFAEREDLYEVLFERIEPLLKKADEAARQLQFDENISNVELAVSGAVDKTIREKRHTHKRNKPDDDKPAGEEANDGNEPERKRKRAQKSDPEKAGSVEQRLGNMRIRIKMDENDPAIIGRIEEAKSCWIVHLNPAYDLIDFNNFNELALVSIMLYANYRTHSGLGARLFDGQVAVEWFAREFSKTLQALRVNVEVPVGAWA